MTFSITDKTEAELRAYWERFSEPRPKISHLVENAIQDMLAKEKKPVA